MTYLTKEDWTNNLVPKFSDDKSFTEHLKQISKIISKNTEKKFFQKILISSMIYYQKYIILNNIIEKDLSPLNKLILYCTCIFIASKEANQLFNIKILGEKFQPFFKRLKNFDVDQIQNLIIEKEFDILLSIEFDISIDWPKGILKILKSAKFKYSYSTVI